jgi:RNA polymerase-binding transcription factor DksA
MTTNDLARARTDDPGDPDLAAARLLLEAAWRARVDDITRLNTELLDLFETAGSDSTRAQQEVLDEQLRAAWLAAEQYELALGRIASGTYGTCEDCAQPIAAARLEVIPEASRCTGCQRRR